ncbi:hypothetical protein Hanom_Chr03g00249401 [Helianthus anomalus]
MINGNLRVFLYKALSLGPRKFPSCHLLGLISITICNTHFYTLFHLFFSMIVCLRTKISTTSRQFP